MPRQACLLPGCANCALWEPPLYFFHIHLWHHSFGGGDDGDEGKGALAIGQASYDTPREESIKHVKISKKKVFMFYVLFYTKVAQITRWQPFHRVLRITMYRYMKFVLCICPPKQSQKWNHDASRGHTSMYAY